MRIPELEFFPGTVVKALFFLGAFRQDIAPHLTFSPPPLTAARPCSLQPRPEVTTRKVARPGPAATPDRSGSPRMPLGVRASDNATRYLLERAA